MTAMLKSALLFNFLCLFLTSGTNAQDARLKLAIQSPTLTKIDFNEKISYKLTIQHEEASAADASNLHAVTYIPRFFSSPTVTQNREGAVIKPFNGSLEVKAAALKKGESLTITYDVSLSELQDRKLKAGFHSAVTEAALVWNTKSLTKILSSPLYQSSIEFEITGCSYNLGIDSGLIRGHQLTASSSTPASQPSQARYSDDGWCAEAGKYTNQYIQVFFAKKTRVTKMTTWGRSRKAHWIKKYTLEFSDDGSNWEVYKENGFVKVFEANKDTTNAMSHNLRYTIGFNFMRIRPVEWHIQICFRFELFGCQVSKYDNCVNAIGMESGLIPDEALTNSEGKTAGLENGRLRKRVPNFPFGWQAQSIEDFMQIDLGSVHKVTRIAIQGSDNKPAIFYVMSYFISYSNNSLDWITIKENDKPKKFAGHESSDSAQFPKIVNIIPPVFARYVRYIPSDFRSIKVSRIEIYGCLSEPMYKNSSYRAIPKELGRRVVLLDKKTNLLYVCVYKDASKGRACFSTGDGKVWKEIRGVVNIIGYDESGKAGKALYGIDSHLSYKYSPDTGNHWVSISDEEFAHRKTVSSIVFARKLKDILVGKSPSSDLEFQGSNGKSWGISGMGVHLKDNTNWKLVASWKCCGY